MGNYKVSKEARADLERIWRYGLHKWGVDAADAYYTILIEHFDSLADQPFAYPAVDDIRKGYRRSVCQKGSVYYRTDDGTIEILAIVGRQKTETWLR